MDKNLPTGVNMDSVLEEEVADFETEDDWEDRLDEDEEDDSKVEYLGHENE